MEQKNLKLDAFLKNSVAVVILFDLFYCLQNLRERNRQLIQEKEDLLHQMKQRTENWREEKVKKQSLCFLFEVRWYSCYCFQCVLFACLSSFTYIHLNCWRFNYYALAFLFFREKFRFSPFKQQWRWHMLFCLTIFLFPLKVIRCHISCAPYFISFFEEF